MIFTIRNYRRMVWAQVRSQMQYRFSFGIDLLAAGVITAIEFGSIALVFDTFGSLGGWTLGEVAFLYGLVELSFGLMDLIFSGFDPPAFGQAVRIGRLDQLLLRPMNISAQVLGSAFTLRRIGKVVLGVAIFRLSLYTTQIEWTAAKIAYLPLVVLGMVAFFGGLFVIGATITFWTVESIEAINIFSYGGQYMISHPMHIYQGWLRSFFTFIVPAIFLNYYPALFILGKEDPLQYPPFAPFLSPAIGISILLASLAFWRFGLKHYQSTGT
jgi:viologen exporter family transport system permease protein